MKASSAARNAAFAFIYLILSGELPRHGSLLDSSLIGLQKPDGGVRPIAIGEVWYRVAGLCALTALHELGPSLAPLQLGVGVPGGTEAVGHAVRAALAADPEAVLLTVDQANAFNSLDRSAVFAAVKERAPALLLFVQWAYGGPTALHVVGAPAGTPPVESQVGVRQGDPLGPLLFALAVQKVLERTQAASPTVMVAALHDDISLVGRVQALREAFRVLQSPQGTTGVGLRVQPAKCGVSGAHADLCAELAADLRVRHVREGATVCGTPVGTEAYETGVVHARAAAVIAQVHTLMRLPLPKQSQCCLLYTSDAADE